MECCGTPTQVFAHRKLYECREWIAADPFLISQGRTLMIMDGGVRPYPALVTLVHRFRRILIHAKREVLRELARAFRSEGMQVQERLDVVAGTAEAVMALWEQVRLAPPLPDGWQLTGLTPDCPAAWISAVQDLHVSSGLSPLPGWFLRGGGCGAQTIVLQDQAGAVVGAVTAFDIGRLAEERRVRVGMAASVCLHPAARGRGLSVALNLAALSRAVLELHSEELWEIVEAENSASFAMNERSGLTSRFPGRFLFVEDPVRDPPRPD